MGKKEKKKAKGRERKEMIMYKSFLYLKMYASWGGLCVYVCICYIIFIYNPMCVIYM